MNVNKINSCDTNDSRIKMILLGVQARQQGFLSVLTDEWNVCACTKQQRLNKAYR